MIRDLLLRSTLALAGCALLSACSTQIRLLPLAQTTSVALLEAAGASSVVAGACSGAIAITREDEDGAAVALAVATTVSLADFGSGQFYSDSGCTAAIGSATIPAGADSVSVYFRDTVAESLTFAFGTAAADSASHPLAVSADVPTTLTFSAATTASATVCTAVVVERRDQYGNLASPASSTPVTLSGAGKGSFYTTSACGVTTTTASIASGASAATVYYADAFVETGLTLAATGLTTDASLGLAITGPFAQPATIANATSGFLSGTNAYRLATGDFDGDGNPDFVVTDVYAANTVHVAWGDGAGSVSAGPTLNVGLYPFGVSVMSLRGNGMFDIVTANNGPGANSGNISVILGNGNRTFASATDYNSGLSLRHTNDLASGANLVSTNGHVDLVVTYSGDSGTATGAGVDVFPGNGDGTLGAPTSYADDGAQQGAPSIGDINHDGVLDFAVPLGGSGNANAAFYFNQGGGTGFAKSLFNPGGGYYGNTFAFGDFNGDVFPDWALGLSYFGLFANTGDGTSAFTNTMSRTEFNDSATNRALTGVFTATGFTDMIFIQSDGIANHTGLIFFPGKGNGTFGAPIFYLFTGKPTDAVTGDFNGDGKIDVMMLTQDGVMHFLAHR